MKGEIQNYLNRRKAEKLQGKAAIQRELDKLEKPHEAQ